MAIELSYMGSKRAIAPIVARLAERARGGAFLDAFAGMCAVASNIGTSRPIWCSDVQYFSKVVAGALFLSQSPAPLPSFAETLHTRRFQKNLSALRHQYRALINAESKFLARSHPKPVKWQEERQAELRALSESETDGRRGRIRNTLDPCTLFTSTYSFSYFGIGQCVEIDSIRYAIDASLADGRVSRDDYRWMIVSLGRAMQRVATTPGHFAQYLVPSGRYLERFVRQRKRSVWEEWLQGLTTLSPIGSQRWRKQNHVFQGDSLDMLETLGVNGRSLGVIYADPPYGKDQYSRYYHIWETLVKYDYPSVSGKGLYRADRYYTPFSTKGGVLQAFGRLAAAAASCKSDIILSYPRQGILHQTGIEPASILKEYFRRVCVLDVGDRSYSTFGAYHGQARKLQTEMVYWAKV